MRMVRRPHVYAAEGHAAGGLQFKVKQRGRSQHIYFYHERHKKGRVSVSYMIVWPNGRYSIRPRVGHIRMIGRKITMADVIKAGKQGGGTIRGIRGVGEVVSKVRARRMMEDTRKGSATPGSQVYLKIFYSTPRRRPNEPKQKERYHLVRFKYYLPDEVDDFLANSR